MPIVLDNDPGDRVAQYAWDGAAWRKAALPLGYTDRYAERQSELSAAAGGNTLTGSTVPAGEVWIVTSAHAVNESSAITILQIDLYDGTNNFIIASLLAPAARIPLDLKSPIVLKAGDRLRALFFGCTLNDDLYLDILGYKMAVT